MILPVPEQMLSLFPNFFSGDRKDPPSFRITPVFFSVGINEEVKETVCFPSVIIFFIIKATMAAKLNKDGAQFRHNHRNFDRIFDYYQSYKNHFINNKRKSCFFLPI